MSYDLLKSYTVPDRAAACRVREQPQARHQSRDPGPCLGTLRLKTGGPKKSRSFGPHGSPARREPRGPSPSNICVWPDNRCSTMRQSQEQIDAKTAEAFGAGAAAPSDVVLEAARSGPGPAATAAGPWRTRSAIIPARHGRGRGRGSSRAVATRSRAIVTSPWRRLCRLAGPAAADPDDSDVDEGSRAGSRGPRYRPVTRGGGRF